MKGIFDHWGKKNNPAHVLGQPGHHPSVNSRVLWVLLRPTSGDTFNKFMLNPVLRLCMTEGQAPRERCHDGAVLGHL